MGDSAVCRHSIPYKNLLWFSQGSRSKCTTQAFISKNWALLTQTQDTIQWHKKQVIITQDHASICPILHLSFGATVLWLWCVACVITILVTHQHQFQQQLPGGLLSKDLLSLTILGSSLISSFPGVSLFDHHTGKLRAFTIFWVYQS